MKTQRSGFFWSALLILLAVAPLSAQKPKPKQIIFAVINDGQSIEPIAYVENGKLLQSVGGDAESPKVADFAKNYYRPKATYDLIFGGSVAGKVTVNRQNAETECAPNLATVSTQTAKAKLKGLVMALATDVQNKKAASGLRRLPTVAERSEIETLVRAEYTKQKVAATNLKTLRYHNLTALDVDNDGGVELVGSFWMETAPTERALLFFIAEKAKSGKYALTHSDYKAFKQDEVMNGEIKLLDTGIYNELLLDVFDYDGDGVSEIFTIGQAFEGSNFYAYRREKGKWVKTFEAYNYHCAY